MTHPSTLACAPGPSADRHGRPRRLRGLSALALVAALAALVITEREAAADDAGTAAPSAGTAAPSAGTAAPSATSLLPPPAASGSSGVALGLPPQSATAASGTVAKTDPEPDPGLKVKWRSDWPRFHPVEYGVTAALIAGTVAFNFAGGAKTAGWTDRNGFDEAIRDGIRGRSEGTRRTAQHISDGFYYASLAYPVLDVTVGMWAVRRSGDVAAQQFFIDLEAMSISGFLSFLSNATIARERAYVRTCSETNPPNFPSCSAGGQADGFFSGHTALAATSAALTCSHHIHVPLYGKVGDFIACVSSLGGATATGVLRLVADKHYASDVIVGMALGLASGFLVPEIHYRFGKAAPGASLGLGKRVMPMPFAVADGGGLGFVGVLD